MNDKLIWIDCEMTGLELGRDELVEIAAIVTDGELKPLDSGISLVIKPSAAALSQMGDFVRKMHQDSGLLPEIPNGLEVSEAETQVLEYLGQHFAAGENAPLAGNSVGTDRAFINLQMPKLAQALHYRTVDVSTIKELAKRWFPKVPFQAPEKHGNHRALADILESIEELMFYRKVLFVEEISNSTKIKKIAADISGSLTQSS